MLENELDIHVRSYQPKCTRSRSISEVKLVRAKPVVRWVTTCEALVLNVFFLMLAREMTVLLVVRSNIVACESPVVCLIEF
jgi:hypothetical protein